MFTFSILVNGIIFYILIQYIHDFLGGDKFEKKFCRKKSTCNDGVYGNNARWYV